MSTATMTKDHKRELVAKVVELGIDPTAA